MQKSHFLYCIGNLPQPKKVSSCHHQTPNPMNPTFQAKTRLKRTCDRWTVPSNYIHEQRMFFCIATCESLYLASYIAARDLHCMRKKRGRKTSRAQPHCAVFKTPPPSCAQSRVTQPDASPLLELTWRPQAQPCVFRTAILLGNTQCSRFSSSRRQTRQYRRAASRTCPPRCRS